jgi:hypothetical protein
VVGAGPAIQRRSVTSHLLHVLLVQYFLYGQQLDEPSRSFVKRGAFLFGVAGVAEGDEEAARYSPQPLWLRSSGGSM